MQRLNLRTQTCFASSSPLHSLPRFTSVHRLTWQRCGTDGRVHVNLALAFGPRPASSAIPRRARLQALQTSRSAASSARTDCRSISTQSKYRVSDRDSTDTDIHLVCAHPQGRCREIVDVMAEVKSEVRATIGWQRGGTLIHWRVHLASSGYRYGGR